ncbi:MAG: chromate efflux transporter [Minwuia sp.]|uniref:chromate efflux transporter n=1 Tax=Minwuia sp. TaxID=2493630 RepID=UPI003A841B1D
MTDTSEPGSAPAEHGWRDLFRAFFHIGVLSFGGPAAQIALMHRTLVDDRKWLSEPQFLGALSFCMLLPGPEAMQLCTYAGWRLKGTLGGLLAGLLFVLPGATVMLTLSLIYVLAGDLALVDALFLGVKAAVLAIVLEALLKVSKRALKTTGSWVIAALAFTGIFFLALPFPLIVLAAAVYGFATARHGDGNPAPAVRVSPAQTARTIMIWLAVWLLPLAALFALPDPLLAEIGVFFSKLAVVTFGGAYAVLAYMAQDVVIHHGWLTAGQMMDGLGLAETTPGPLILVTQFVGFLAAAEAHGLWFGVIAAGVTLWVTFAPCFLWIFAGAPYVEWIAAQPRLAGALSAITAAVVGVILNLSVWFALHVLFGEVTRTESGPFVLWLPELATADPVAVGLAVLSAVLLLGLHLGVAWTLAIASGLGLLISGLI